MTSLLLNLLPLVIGAAAGGPMWIIVALLLLRTDRGVFKAAAFAAGATTVRLLQFILFSRIFGRVLDSSGGQLEMGLLSAVLLLLAGIVLLITAVRTWFKETDPDAPPSKWLAAINRISPPAAFGMAVVMMFLAFKQWVFTLSAIAVIDEAEIGKIGSLLVYILFILVAQALMLAPMIASALAPAQSAKLVGGMLSRLERHSRAITIAVSLIFAVWFISKSVSQLLGHAGDVFPKQT